MVFNVATQKDINDVLKQNKNDIIINVENDITMTEPVCIDGCNNVKLMSQNGAKLSGGIVIENFKREGEFLTFETDVEPRVLIVNSSVKARSSYPCNEYLECLDKTELEWMNSRNGGWNRPPEYEELTHITVQKEDIPEEFDILNCDVRVIHVWDESTVSVEKYDSTSGVVTTASPMAHPSGAFGKHQYQFLNTMYGLKVKGTWCYNRTEHKIYYLPEDGEKETNIKAVIPTSHSVIKINDSKNVCVENLTVFVSNSESGVISGLRAVNPSGAVQVENSENVTLNMLDISMSGGQGIKALKSKNIEIKNCIISKCASCGIVTFECENEKISHNEITDIGMFDYSAIAIHAGGKSLLVYVLDGEQKEKGQSIIEYNTVDNVPYCGITCNGGPHIIKFNKITRSMTKLHDGAAIYCSRGDKTVVEGNFITSVPDAEKSYAIYFDELSENCIADGNLSVDVVVPVHTHIANNIIFKNNIFINKKDISMRFTESDSLKWCNNIIQSEGEVNIIFDFSDRGDYVIKDFVEFDKDTFSCKDVNVIYKFAYQTTERGREDISTLDSILFKDAKISLENNRVLLGSKLNDIENKYIVTKTEPHCVVTKIKPEKEAEYIKLHKEIWDQVVKNGHLYNIRNYSIFKYKDLYISFFEYVGDDFAKDMKEKNQLPITKKWQKLCDECYIKSEIDPELIFFERF